MFKLCLILFMFILFALGIAHAEELIDRNVLIDQYGLEDTELLDSFIQELQLTDAYLKKVNITYLFEAYKENIENAFYSFDYLFEATENNDEFEFRASVIARVAFFENPNNEVRALLFDLEAERVFYGEHYIYHNIREAESIPLDNKKVQALVEALSNVSGWEASYAYAPGEEDEDAEAVVIHTSWIAWALSIEFLDGGIRQFTGSGPSAEHFPENYTKLCNGLWAIVR